MLNSVPNYQSLTPQEIVAYLTESVIVPSGRGRLTHSWVAENISLAAADGIYDAINAVSDPSALRYVTGNGIDTSATLWKQQAESVAASSEALAPLLPTLRDFESVTVPRWQHLGLAAEPTVESVEKEIIVTSTRTAVKSRATAINAWLDVLDVSAMTVQQVREYVDSLLASEDGNP